MPDETEFAETFQDAQEDLERREKNAKKRRTMMMWKNALDEQWKMRAIIDADGGRTPYWALNKRG